MWLALLTSATYWCVAGRPSDPLSHAFKRLGQVLMSAIALYSVPAFNGLGVSRWDIVNTCAIVLGAAIGWRRRRRIPRDLPPPKARFSLGLYVLAAVFLVAWHQGVASLSARLADSEVMRNAVSTPGIADDLLARATVFVIFFAASQISTAALQRGFARSLQHDWSVVEKWRHRRVALLALFALPIAACIVPSITTGALLGGVLLRLATLFAAWWLTRDAPPERDADFLSWSLLKILSTLLHRRAAPST